MADTWLAKPGEFRIVSTGRYGNRYGNDAPVFIVQLPAKFHNATRFLWAMCDQIQEMWWPGQEGMFEVEGFEVEGVDRP